MKKLTILLFTASILFAGNLENFLKNDSQELEINKSKDIKEETIDRKWEWQGTRDGALFWTHPG